MATCLTYIKIIGADLDEYNLWKDRLQVAITDKGFVVDQDDPSTFLYAIRHEDTI